MVYLLWDIVTAADAGWLMCINLTKSPDKFWSLFIMAIYGDETQQRTVGDLVTVKVQF